MIRIPDSALVLLIGASGSGKSTFASRHFDGPTVISSDQLRGALAGDEGDQHATDAAFARLHQWLDTRLAAGAPSVGGAAKVEGVRRPQPLRRARQQGRPAVAVTVGLPPHRCLARK